LQVATGRDLKVVEDIVLLSVAAASKQTSKQASKQAGEGENKGFEKG